MTTEIIAQSYPLSPVLDEPTDAIQKTNLDHLDVIHAPAESAVPTPLSHPRANYGGLKYTANWWEWHRAQRAYDGGSR